MSWLQEKLAQLAVRPATGANCPLRISDEAEGCSFGELTESQGLAESLVQALESSARFCEDMAATFEPPKEEEEGESLSDQLEKLLAKYEDSEALQDGSTQSTGLADPGDPELLAQLEEHVAACRRIRDHLGKPTAGVGGRQGA